MLVLSRKKNETIEIAGGEITLVVVEIRGDKVRLGIEAPKDIEVHRGEVAEAIRRRLREDQVKASVGHGAADGLSSDLNLSKGR